MSNFKNNRNACYANHGGQPAAGDKIEGFFSGKILVVTTVNAYTGVVKARYANGEIAAIKPSNYKLIARK